MMIEAKDAKQLVLDKFVGENLETIANINEDIKDAAQKGHTSINIHVTGADFARSLNRYLTAKGYSVFSPPLASQQELLTMIIKW